MGVNSRFFFHCYKDQSEQCQLTTHLTTLDYTTSRQREWEHLLSVLMYYSVPFSKYLPPSTSCCMHHDVRAHYFSLTVGPIKTGVILLGWMDGCKSRFKDFLQHSKILFVITAFWSSRFFWLTCKQIMKIILKYKTDSFFAFSQ